MKPRSFTTCLMAAALALSLAACGSSTETPDTDSDDASAAASSSASPEESAESAPAIDPAAEAAAEAALLTLSDMPVGWEATPRVEDGGGEGEDTALAACMGDDDPFPTNPDDVVVYSPTFTNADEDEIESSVRINRDEADSLRAFESLRTDKLSTCLIETLEQAMTASADADLTVGEIAFDEVSLGDYGDDTVSYLLTVPASVEDLDFEVSLMASYVRVGRAIAHITGSRAPFGSLADEEFAALLELGASRLVDQADTLNS